MSESFDPYYKWLGIPPKDQPPNHYRLLGLELFEDDADVIESAAERQATYLHELSTGEHVSESQRLLNEVAAARLCLLDPQKKETYDDELRSVVAAAVAESELAGSDASPDLPWEDLDVLSDVPAPSDTLGAMDSGTQVNSGVSGVLSGASAVMQPRPAAQPSQGVPTLWLAVGGGVGALALVLVVVLLIVFSGGSDPVVQDNGRTGPDASNGNGHPNGTPGQTDSGNGSQDPPPDQANVPVDGDGHDTAKQELVGHYTFEDSADALADAIGQNRGTNNDLTIESDSQMGKSVLVFDGNGHARIRRLIEEDFSIAFWIKANAAGKAEGGWHEGVGIIGAADSESQGFGVVQGGKKLGFGVGPNDTIWTPNNLNAADNRWHHVAVTRDAGSGTIRIFFDGKRKATATAPGGPLNAPDELVLGMLDSNGQMFKGRMADLRIYNYVIPEDTIGELAKPPASAKLAATDTANGKSPPAKAKTTPPKKETVASKAQPAKQPPEKQPPKKIGFIVLKPTDVSSLAGASFEVLEDSSILVRDGSPRNDNYTIEAKTDLQGITAIRLEAVPHDDIPGKGPGRGVGGKFVLGEVMIAAAPASNPLAAKRVPLAGAVSDDEEGVERITDGNESSIWAVSRRGQPTSATVTMQSPLTNTGGTFLAVRLYQGDTLGCFRLSATTDDEWLGKKTLPPPKLPLAVNLGGEAFVDRENRIEWVASQPYEPGSFGHVEGKPLSGGGADSAFLSCVAGLKAFRVAVPAGRYDIRLFFSECWERDPNARTFSVTVEGRHTKNNVNVHKSASGFRKPFILPLQNVVVNDGVLDVEFKKGKSDPILNGIMVRKSY